MLWGEYTHYTYRVNSWQCKVTIFSSACRLANFKRHRDCQTDVIKNFDKKILPTAIDFDRFSHSRFYALLITVFFIIKCKMSTFLSTSFKWVFMFHNYFSIEEKKNIFSHTFFLLWWWKKYGKFGISIIKTIVWIIIANDWFRVHWPQSQSYTQ